MERKRGNLLNYSLIIGLSVLVIVVGAILVYGAGYEGTLAGFLSNLGDTLMVAGVVTLTFETLTHSFIHKEIRRIEDASAVRLLKEILPVPVFDAVRESITREPFIIEDLNWRLEISPYTPDPELVHLTITSEYTARNWTQTPERFTLKQTSEKRLVDYRITGSTKFTLLKIVYKGETLAEENEESMLSKGLVKPDPDRKIPLFLQYETKPKIQSNDDLRVTVVRERLSPLVAEFPYVTFLPTKRIDATVMLNGVQLEVQAYPMHPLRDAAWRKEGTMHWTLGNDQIGVLPGNGINFNWHPLHENR